MLRLRQLNKNSCDSCSKKLRSKNQRSKNRMLRLPRLSKNSCGS
jgi:hypothetical protein